MFEHLSISIAFAPSTCTCTVHVDIYPKHALSISWNRGLSRQLPALDVRCMFVLDVSMHLSLPCFCVLIHVHVYIQCTSTCTFGLHTCMLFRSAKLAMCVLTNTCMGVGVTLVSEWEVRQQGLTLDTLLQPLTIEDGFHMGWVMAMLLVDTVFYMMVAW